MTASYSPWDAFAMRAALHVAAILLLAVPFTASSCGGDDEEPAPVEVSLVYPIADMTGFRPVQRTLPAGADPLTAALELLLAGPTDGERTAAGVVNPFPPGTRLLGVSRQGDTVTVDLSADVLGYGGGSAAVLAIEGAISRTVSAIVPGAGTIILVEGQPGRLQP